MGNSDEFVRRYNMDEEAIRKRIEQLKVELEQMLAEANRQIGMKQGAIQELQRLLEREKE